MSRILLLPPSTWMCSACPYTSGQLRHVHVIETDQTHPFMDSSGKCKGVAELECSTYLILPSSNPHLLSRRDKIQWVDKLALTWHITGEARVPGRWADLRRWPCASCLHAKTCWCSNIIRQFSALLLLTIRNGLIYYHNVAVFLIKVTKKSEQ